MDKLEKYREIIIDLLKEFSKRKPVNMPELDVQIVIDKENDHYFLYDVGWNELERIHDCVFHFDIIDGKVWLQEDNTNAEAALLLVEKGIPKSDIVLGFQAPYKRQYTEFAVA
ncbi:MAG: XisI protein [Leptospiraceae bacterium]|nr:XisI protein [Leptospiraceae bacterium]